YDFSSPVAGSMIWYSSSIPSVSDGAFICAPEGGGRRGGRIMPEPVRGNHSRRGGPRTTKRDCEREYRRAGGTNNLFEARGFRLDTGCWCSLARPETRVAVRACHAALHARNHHPDHSPPLA